MQLRRAVDYAVQVIIHMAGLPGTTAVKKLLGSWRNAAFQRVRVTEVNASINKALCMRGPFFTFSF
jgi:hypothetical protein